MFKFVAVALALVLAVAVAEVAVLNSNNFDEVVGQDGSVAFVKFYAPWCGHCKRLAPTWEELGNADTGATIAKVDCTQDRQLCSRFGVRGYPTLKLFKNGPDGEAEKYQGARSIDAFTSYLSKHTNAGKDDL